MRELSTVGKRRDQIREIDRSVCALVLLGLLIQCHGWLYLLATRRHRVFGQLTTGGREMPAESDCRLFVDGFFHEALFGRVCGVVTRLR